MSRHDAIYQSNALLAGLAFFSISTIAGLFGWISYTTHKKFERTESFKTYCTKMQSLDYKQAIAKVKTPEDAAKYLTVFLSYQPDKKTFGIYDYIASFKRIHENRHDDCDGGAIAAAALLSDNGYPPLILVMYNYGSKRDAHAVFPYQENKRWGMLGINSKDCQWPTYDSIEEMVRTTGEYDSFYINNIAKICHNWIDNDINNLLSTKIIYAETSCIRGIYQRTIVPSPF